MISLCTALFSFALFVQDAPLVSPEVAWEWRVRALAMGDEPWPEDVAELEAASLGERAGLDVVRQHLGKLVDNVLEDVLGRVVQQGLEGGQVDALLDD